MTYVAAVPLEINKNEVFGSPMTDQSKIKNFLESTFIFFVNMLNSGIFEVIKIPRILRIFKRIIIYTICFSLILNLILGSDVYANFIEENKYTVLVSCAVSVTISLVLGLLYAYLAYKRLALKANSLLEQLEETYGSRQMMGLLVIDGFLGVFMWLPFCHLIAYLWWSNFSIFRKFY